MGRFRRTPGPSPYSSTRSGDRCLPYLSAEFDGVSGDAPGGGSSSVETYDLIVIVPLASRRSANMACS